MRLSDVATIKANFPEADFWLVRKGSSLTVGEPTFTFNPEYIGIKIEKTDILVPDYLYYVFLHAWREGHWKRNSYGTLNLVHIRASDVRAIELSPA